MTQPMRERLVVAAYAAAKVTRLEAQAIVDAVLAELRAPDAAMIAASLDRRQGPDDTLYGSIFTAMVDHVRAQKRQKRPRPEPGALEQLDGKQRD